MYKLVNGISHRYGCSPEKEKKQKKEMLTENKTVTYRVASLMEFVGDKKFK